jgi:hypothetical protein
MASRAVRVVVADLHSFTTRLVQRLALNINAELIEATPIDTGWARANWVPNIGSPFEGTAGTYLLARGGLVDNSTRDSALVDIATSYRLGPEIHQTNNVPYIELLNAGSSAQAPAGFVQAAILRAVRLTVRNTR